MTVVSDLFTAEVEPVEGIGVGLNAITSNKTTVRATFKSLSDSLTPFRYRVEGTDSRYYIEDQPVVEFKYTKVGLIATTFTVFFRDENGDTVTDSCTIHYYVYAYEEPKVVPAISGATDIVCRRSNDSGEASAAGANIRITAARSYTKIMDVSGSRQVNHCAIRYRWKIAASSEYGEWEELLPADNSNESNVDTVLQLGLGINESYDIEVGVIDTAGGTGSVTRRIPTARTPLHLGKGGKNVGLGGFCNYNHTEAIDAFWDAWFHRNLEVGGDAAFMGDVQVKGDAQFEGAVRLDGGINTQEIFKCQNSTDAGWVSGQTLADAFPDADGSLLDKGTLFVMEILRTISIQTGATTSKYQNTYRILLVKSQDIIEGSGIGYFYFKNAISEEQKELMKMTVRIAGTNHELTAYYGSGSVSEFAGNVSVRALYVLL